MFPLSIDCSIESSRPSLIPYSNEQGSSFSAQRQGKFPAPLVVMDEHPTEILPNLFISRTGDPLLDDVEKLKNLGLSVLINCGEPNHIEKIRRGHYGNDFHTIDLLLKDNSKEDILEVLKKVLPAIKRAQDENKKCLLHCQACMSRSVTISVAYLISYEGYTLLDSMTHVKSLRNEASPNPAYMEQLVLHEQAHRRDMGLSNVNLITIDVNLYRRDRFGHPHDYATVDYHQDDRSSNNHHPLVEQAILVEGCDSEEAISWSHSSLSPMLEAAA